MKRLQNPCVINESYSHDWEVDPGLYEDLRTQGYKNMDDLVDAVEHIAEEIGEDGEQRN